MSNLSDSFAHSMDVVDEYGLAWLDLTAIQDLLQV